MLPNLGELAQQQKITGKKNKLGRGGKKKPPVLIGLME